MEQTFVRPSFDGNTFTGVEVNVGGEHFLIEPHDLSDGDRTWNDTMKLLELTGNKTFTYKQVCAVMLFHDEINTILKENGGEPLDKWYWTCAECSRDSAFVGYAGGGFLGHVSKLYSFSCRAVLTLDSPIETLPLNETDRLSDLEKKVAVLAEDIDKIKNLFK